MSEKRKKEGEEGRKKDEERKKRVLKMGLRGRGTQDWVQRKERKKKKGDRLAGWTQATRQIERQTNR